MNILSVYSSYKRELESKLILISAQIHSNPYHLNYSQVAAQLNLSLQITPKT